MSNSTNNHLRLVKLEPTSFAGLNISNPEDQSLVIAFPDEGKNALILEGDQGTGKSSMLECLKFIFTGDEPENAINSITNDKKVKAIFSEKDGDIMYFIKATKTGYSIEKHEKKDGTIEKSTVQQPKNWLRNKIGPVGIDPSFLKRMNPERQIEWVRDLIKLDAEKKEQESAIRKVIKQNYSKRRDANKNKKAKKQSLIASGYYLSDRLNKKEIIASDKYAEDVAKYAKPIEERQAEVSNIFEEANVNNNNLVSLRDKLNNPIHGLHAQGNRLSEKSDKIRDQISQLQIELAENEVLIESTKLSCQEVIAEIELLMDAPEKLEEAKKTMEKMNEYIVAKTNFAAIQKTYSEYQELTSSWKDLDTELEVKEKELQAFILTITPDIPGLELCIPQDINVEDELSAFKDEYEDATPEQIAAKEKELKDKTREGIYYKGHSITELCESEIWGLCTMIWKYQNVPVIFIENVSSLGSDAIATINQFLENGGQVYATRMNRELKTMKISFEDHL